MPRRHSNASERTEKKMQPTEIKKLMENLHGKAKAAELAVEQKKRERYK